MLIGLFFALAACFVWGMIFVIPDLLSDFTPIEVTLGRFLAYGTFSSGLLLSKGIFRLNRFPLRAWGVAFLFALIANILYYIGVIIGLRYATPPVTVLLLGMCPIVVAFYGNWHTKECRYRDLLIPCLWIILGMVLVNIAEVDWTFSKYTPEQYIIGLLCVVGALLSWSWYSVHNARFLKKNIHVPRGEWATLIGVGTLFWILIFGVVFVLMHSSEVNLEKFTHFNTDLFRFVAAALVLGVVCSWFGGYFWNQASSYLPVSLMGPFIIFETIFGLTFVFLYEFRLPSWLEFLGISIMLGGIYVAVRNRQRAMVAQKMSSPDTEGA